VPAYDTRTAAIVLGISSKELDNLLSRSAPPGVISGPQGSDRRISLDAIQHVAIGREIRGLAGCSWRRALELSAELGRSGEVTSTSGLLAIRVDARALREAIQSHLIEASEYVVRPRRGRRPARRIAIDQRPPRTRTPTTK
jgi:hypothetical protein